MAASDLHPHASLGQSPPPADLPVSSTTVDRFPDSPVLGHGRRQAYSSLESARLRQDNLGFPRTFARTQTLKAWPIAHVRPPSLPPNSLT